MFANELRNRPVGVHPIAAYALTDTAPDRSASLRGECAVIREMLSELDTFTYPGQLQNMAKIVGFMKKNGGRVLQNVSPRNRRTFAQLLDDLAVECRRPLPDSTTFCRGAESLLTLLAAAA